MTVEELPITGLPARGVRPDVIVCGDPARAERIAARLDEARPLSRRREYHAFDGQYRGLPLTVCSHGVGAPGAAACFEELIHAGARRILRVGTCGSLRRDLESGHLVVATAAVQNTGYGREVVPDGYPAAPDLDLTWALRNAAGRSGRPYRAGIVLSRDAFYGGAPIAVAPDYPVMSAANVLAVEMECAALFFVGSLRQAQTAAILAVDGVVIEAGESVESYQPQRPIVQDAVAAAIEIALEALAAA